MKKLVSALLCMAMLICMSCRKEKNTSDIVFVDDLEAYDVPF